MIVEDEILIGLRIAAALRDVGCDVVGPLGTVARAAAEAERQSIDVALLDVRLHEKTVEPIAEILDRRHIPFAVVTANSPDRLPASLLERLYVPKPFTDQDIQTAVADLLNSKNDKHDVV